MKKQYITALAVLLVTFVMMGVLSVRFAHVITREAPKDYDTSEGVSYLQALESANVADRENELRSGGTVGVTRAPSTTALQTDNFRAAFKDTVISGDSLIKALTEYRILDTTNVFAEVGAGTEHLEQMTGKIVAKNPTYLVLHYGENDLDRKERAPYFIRDYKEVIETLQQRLPNTKIFVDTIWPVMEKAHKSEPYTVNIDYYNGLIKEMCKELGVTCLDYDPLFKSFTENYYDPDGIHPKYSFYKEQFLPFLYKETHS